MFLLFTGLKQIDEWLIVPFSPTKQVEISLGRCKLLLSFCYQTAKKRVLSNRLPKLSTLRFLSETIQSDHFPENLFKTHFCPCGTFLWLDELLFVCLTMESP